MTKYVTTRLVAAGLIASAALALPAMAAGLTSAQVQAILSLLQSFGADQNTVNNVSAALGGSSPVSLSCSAFADLHYGDFDDAPGGRVSQLQTWLGIPSSTFGFGTYGHKTEAAWQSVCGGSTNTNTTTNASANFTATPTSGAAPLNVGFGGFVSGNINDYLVDFGDGSTAQGSCGHVNCTLGRLAIIHAYQSAGTYTATLSSLTTRGVVSTATITVTSVSTNTGPTITATPAEVASGATMHFAFSYPQSTVKATLTYDTCHVGSVWPAVGCGSELGVTGYTDFTASFYNLTPQKQTITAIYTTYGSDGSTAVAKALVVIDNQASAAPTLTSVSPPGILGWGDTVTLMGSGFNSSTKVYLNGFGGYVISPSSVSGDGTTLTFSIPVNPAPHGNVSVGVSNDGVTMSNLLYVSIAVG